MKSKYFWVKIKLKRKLNKPEEENAVLDPEAFNSVLNEYDYN